MNKIAASLSVLIAVWSVGGAIATGRAVAGDRLAASGLYIQEFWTGGRPGYWIGNSGASPASIRLIGRRAQTKSNPNAVQVDTGLTTIPPGGAATVAPEDFVGLADVLVRNANDTLLGVLLAPTPPPAASVQSGDMICLCNSLNSVAPQSKALWFEMNSVPILGAPGFETALKVNGPQAGFIVIRNSANKALAAAKIVSVTSTGFPVKQAVNGDWYVDTRKPANPPLQTVLIDYSLPAAKQQSLVLIDARFENTRRVPMPLLRAVLIGQPNRIAPVPAPRGSHLQNRSNRGR